MTAVYRKYGRVAHYEHGHLVIASESGESVEDGERFTVTPLAGEVPLPPADSLTVEQVAHEIEGIVEPPLHLERLIVSHGLASHEFEGRRWSDETRRIHASIASPMGVRALVDRGDFDLTDLRLVARSLGRLEDERDEPQRLRLAPRVTAALIPMLEGVAPPNVELWQSAGGFDGHGLPIQAQRIGARPWPNWYRPSYRVRPVRMPMNVHLRCGVTAIDRDLPEAVAILEPVSGLFLRVLVEEKGRVHSATIRVSRIDAVGSETCWYPYGAGAYGAEVML